MVFITTTSFVTLSQYSVYILWRYAHVPSYPCIIQILPRNPRDTRILLRHRSRGHHNYWPTLRDNNIRFRPWRLIRYTNGVVMLSLYDLVRSTCSRTKLICRKIINFMFTYLRHNYTRRVHNKLQFYIIIIIIII